MSRIRNATPRWLRVLGSLTIIVYSILLYRKAKIQTILSTLDIAGSRCSPPLIPSLYLIQVILKFDALLLHIKNCQTFAESTKRLTLMPTTTFDPPSTTI